MGVGESVGVGVVGIELDIGCISEKYGFNLPAFHT